MNAIEEERDSLIWQMWLSLYPFFSKEGFISYPDYKSKILAQNKPKRDQTDDEMLAMARILNAAFGGTVVEA